MSASRESLRNPVVELPLLVAASVACVVVLTLAVASGGSGGPSIFSFRHLLLVALAAGLIALSSALVAGALRRAQTHSMRASEEASRLRQTLAMVEAVIRTEPQSLIFWEHGQGVRVVTHTLAGVPGLPAAVPDLLKFGQWLEPVAAEELKKGLDALFSDGRSFNLILKTAAGAHLEAEGRAAGGRAILRMRDTAGYKSDLVKILDQNRELRRGVDASTAILDDLPFPAWIRTKEGQLSWVNRAYARAVDVVSSADVVSRQIELLESRQRGAVSASLGSGQIFRGRLPLIIGSETRPHDVAALPIEIGSVGVALDATALASARGELDRKVASYDRTLDRVATAVAIFGSDHKLTFFNEAFAKLWKLDHDWLASQPLDGEILDQLRSLAMLPEVANYRDWKSHVLSGSRTEAANEDWWHLPDGRTVHLLIEQRADGGVTYLFDDVTERLALESRYNALIDVQSETLNHLKEGVAVFGTDGRLRLFNSSFANIWKLSRKLLMATPHVDEIITHCRMLHDDPRTWQLIGREVTGISDHRQPVEGQMTRPDLSVIDFATLPLPDGGTLLTFADVTVSKRYERALRERNEALEAADRQKSQFISHVSYELRTPLTNIIGFSDMLVQPWSDALTERQRGYVADIAGSSRQLLAIINDILDLATIDAGALELKLAPMSTQAVIDAALLAVTDRAERAGIRIESRVGPGADELIADESRVRQVIYNLLSNAIGFSKQGGTIRVTCSEDHDMIAFTVEDRGVGIPKDQLDRVFERFESKSQGSRHRGAGLGLSVVKSLVELHKGDLTLSSEPGEGTRVTVRFPKRRADGEFQHQRAESA